MVFITNGQVAQLLDIENCIPLMRETLKSLARGEAEQVLRTAISLGNHNVLGLMPAVISGRKLSGAKIISVFPDNFSKGLPSHQGVVVLFETETGTLKAVVDGEGITAVRTAAVSAVATDALAGENAESLALLGSGLQARQHLRAIRMVRDIKRVFVWDIDATSAERYAAEMTEETGLPVTVCADSRMAAERADIICTVTAAIEPILFGESVRPGTHINAVGACSAGSRELDTALVAKSRFFGDRRESVMGESGDLLIPIAEGAVEESHFLGELGDVLLGKTEGRANAEEITVFESLGLAVEDLAAADLICTRYLEGGQQP